MLSLGLGRKIEKHQHRLYPHHEHRPIYVTLFGPELALSIAPSELMLKTFVRYAEFRHVKPRLFKVVKGVVEIGNVTLVELPLVIWLGLQIVAHGRDPDQGPVHLFLIVHVLSSSRRHQPGLPG